MIHRKDLLANRPERLSYPDAAAALSTVLARLITFHPLTIEEETQGRISAVLPTNVAEMNAQAVGLFAQGDSDYLTDDVPTLLGRAGRGDYGSTSSLSGSVAWIATRLITPSRAIRRGRVERWTWPSSSPPCRAANTITARSSGLAVS